MSSMGGTLNVLLVEDSEDDALLVLRQLEKGGFLPDWVRVDTAPAMEEALKRRKWDIVLCDYRMPHFDAPSALAVLKKMGLDIPFIIVSGTIGEETAVNAMKAGAHDYLMKGNLGRLVVAVEREVREANIRTERRGMEETIRVSDRRFRAMVEKGADVIILVDREGIITYVSPTFKSAMGMEPSYVEGKPVLDFIEKFVHPDDIESMMGGMSAVLDTNGGESSGECRYLHGDGTWHHLLAITNNHLEDPAVKGIIINLMDITERKRAEESLRASETKYRMLVDTMTDVMFTLDFDGNVIDIGQAIQKIIGFTKAEIIGKSFSDFIHPDDLPIAQGEFLKAIQGEGRPIEIRVYHTDGAPRWVNINALLIMRDGEPDNLLCVLTNIHERRAAEEALKESEYYLQESQKIAGLGTYSLDIPAGMFTTSEVMDDLFGIDKEYDHSIAGWAACLHPDDRMKVLDYLKNDVIGSRQLFDMEFRIVRFKDKDTRWLHALGRLELDAEGRPKTIRGTAQDISERKKAEEDIRTSEQRYRVLVESLNEGIWTIDKDSRTTFVNAQMARMLGYNVKEMIGKTLFDFMDEQWSRLAEQKVEARKNGVHEQHDFEFLRKDGSRLFVVMETAPLSDKDGRYIGAIAGVMDVSNQKRAEEERKAKQALIESITETSPAGILMVDAGGIITYANPRAEEILRLKKGSAAGRAYDSPVWQTTGLDDESFPEEELPFRKVMSTRKSVTDIRHAIRTHSGERILLSVNGAPLKDGKGAVSGVVLTIEDITKLVADDRRIAASLKEKEALLREVHHRVKNNMQVIISLLSLQSRRVKDERVMAAFKESQDRIRAMSLIHERLYRSEDMARVDFGDYAERLVKQMLRLYGMGPDNVKLELALEPIPLGIDTAVPCGLILNELVTNCLKHAFPNEKKCEMRLELKWASKGRIRLSISDSGVGLPKGFDPKTSDTMGFQMITSLVEQIDGSLKVENKKGTTVTIEFPDDPGKKIQ